MMAQNLGSLLRNAHSGILVQYFQMIAGQQKLQDLGTCYKLKYTDPSNHQQQSAK